MFYFQMKEEGMRSGNKIKKARLKSLGRNRQGAHSQLGTPLLGNPWLSNLPPKSHFPALVAKEIDAPTQPYRKPARSCDTAAPAAACAPSAPISTLRPGRHCLVPAPVGWWRLCPTARRWAEAEAGATGLRRRSGQEPAALVAVSAQKRWPSPGVGLTGRRLRGG